MKFIEIIKLLQDFGASILNICGFFILVFWNFKQMEKREARYSILVQELIDLQEKISEIKN